MIVGISGKIIYKDEMCLHIQTNNGLAYEVFTTSKLILSLQINNSISLLIKHIIREDAQILYGFVDVSQKQMFLKIIKVQGVGPKVALAICSMFSPKDFMNIVLKKDSVMLSKTQGIGPKSALKILHSLSDFSIDINLYEEQNTKDMSLVYGALSSLGFKKNTINQALDKCDLTLEVNEIVKNALQKLNG
jgi:Holliday junction DNA helicase RuvA